MAKKKLGGQDSELASINAILNALDGLDGESIQRVLDYVIGRLSIPRSISGSGSLVASQSSITTAPPAATGRLPSIKDFKEQKEPASANQMAAVVAFYLSEIAPAEERQPSINSADLERYFKQARFKLPNRLANALPNAAAAGYFDAQGNGHYKLNAVGYNLVAHSLPRGGESSGKGSKKK
jgi:hypothetical protein